MFHSILVAVDGSEAASEALQEAIDLARAERARLTPISVAVRSRWPVTGPYVVPMPTEDELVRTTRDIVDRAEALVPDDIRASTVVSRGDAAKAILERVETGQHDLVVMGSRGRGEAGALLLGRVSRSVLAHSRVPVLVTRAQRPERARTPAAPPPSH